VHSPTSDLVVPEVVPILPLLVEHAVEEIVATPETNTDKRKRHSERSIYSARAIMAYLHKLLIDQLDTLKTWSFQEFDLRFYEEIECHFGHKEAWSGTHRIADRSANILIFQIVSGIYRGECTHII
jgi:hypothetical protein